MKINISILSKCVTIWVLIWATRYTSSDTNVDELTVTSCRIQGQKLITVHGYETEKEAQAEFAAASHEQQKRMRILQLPDNTE